MQLTNILPPIAIPGIILLLLVVALLQILGSRQARKGKRTRQLILQHARVHAAKKVTVIVELARRADTILPTLDHLYSHEYRKLEVIVVVKQTAGSKAKSALDSYRRKNQRKGLRIISYRKGLSAQAIARRYASGDLIFRLEPSNQLEPGFFSMASFCFIDSDLDVLQPQTAPRLNHTLMSAVGALAALLGDSLAMVSPRTTPSVAASRLPARVIVRKRWLTANASSPVTAQTYSNQLFITTESQSAGWLISSTLQRRTFSWIFRSVAVLCAATISLLVIWMAVIASVGFAFSVLLLGYCAVLIPLIAGSRCYGMVAKFNLILFTPFSPVAFTALLIIRTWKKYRISFHVTRSLATAIRLPAKG